MHLKAIRGFVLMGSLVSSLACAAVADALESGDQELAESAAMQGNADDASQRIQDSVPEFGGIFFRQGASYVFLTDLTDADKHLALITAFAARVNPAQTSNPGRFTPSDVHFLRGDFNWKQLMVFKAIMVDALALKGSLSVDIDDASNRIVFEVEDDNCVEPVRAYAAKNGVPPDALLVRVGKAVRVSATLQDLFRPTKGGNLTESFNGGNNWCTEMMVVQLTSGFVGMRGYFTNSHCSVTWGALDSGTFFQNFYPNQVGAEMIDPGYTTFAGCGAGLTCRKAEVTFVGFSYTPYNSYGIVGQFHKPSISCTLPTTSCTPYTLSTTTLLATGPAPATMVGAFRNKIGVRTGWTGGPASGTCITLTNFGLGPTKSLICQDTYDMGVNGGDSGSPVFVLTSATTITISGVLWGEQATNGVFLNNKMVASPFGNFATDPGLPTFTYF